MNIKEAVKAVLKKTRAGKAQIAWKKIHHFADRFLLTPEQAREGLGSPEKQVELLADRKEKFPDLWEQQNDRIDWLIASPLNTRGDLEPLRQRMLFHYFAYGFSPSEYLVYDLGDKTAEELRDYISDRDGVRYAHRINEPDAHSFFFNKNKTYETFRPYFCRDAVFVHAEQDRGSFRAFVEKHPVFVKKPARESCGRGVELVDTTELSDRELDGLFDEYLKTGKIFLEERIVQSEELNSLNRSTVNTVRCLTLVTKHGVIIPWCGGALGRAGYFINNGAAGGLLTGIDVQTGRTFSDGVDEFGIRYRTHPDNGLAIEGFQYPEWDEMLRICREMAAVMSGARWIGWDMAHTEKGWVVVEGNSIPELIAPQAIWQRGIKKEFEAYLKDVQTVL